MPTIIDTALHYVGNKQDEEGMICSKSLLKMDDATRNALSDYFNEAFANEVQYHFVHDSDLGYNEVYGYLTEIFNDPSRLLDGSVKLAKHLYEKSNHPKIKAGEFYVALFDNCHINGEDCKAIGMFKSENKDTFLRVWASEQGIDMTTETGINTKKLDKGCIVYHTNADDGYIVTVIDNTNRSDAHYWTDEFLQVMQKQNDYYHTNELLTMTKQFVTKELPQQFEVSRADQADMLNRSMAFFKQNDVFDMQDFTEQVIEQPAVIESFHKFKDQYQEKEDVVISDEFAINGSALKRQERAYKSVIKLDKNFHIYIHGNRDLIEQGEDDKGKFYKVYYNKES